MNHAYEIHARNVRSPFLFVGDLSTNMPAYPVALLYRIIPNTDIATRIPSVIYAIIFLIWLFFLATELFGKKAGFFTLYLAVFSIWNIHNSRLAWHNLSTNEPLVAGSLLYLVRYLKYRHIRDVFFLACIVGTAVNLLYIPALLLPVSALCFIVYALLAMRGLNISKIIQHGRSFLVTGSVFFVFFLILTAPTFVKLSKYSHSLSRHRGFTKENADKSLTSGMPIAYYANQFLVSISYFRTYPDNYRSDGPWGPAMNPSVVFLYYSGLAYLLTSFSMTSFVLLVAWGIMFVPVVLLYITGSVWRFIDFSPFVYLFSGLTCVLFLQFITHVTPLAFSRRRYLFFVFVIMCFISVPTLIEFRSYYYLRTNEGQNHVFQLCKKAEQKLYTEKFTQLVVGDDWCGRVLRTVFSYRSTVVSLVHSISNDSYPKGTIVVRLLSNTDSLEPINGKILGVGSDRRDILVTDDMAVESIGLEFLD